VSKLHPATSAAWAGATAVIALLTRNPLYLMLIVLGASVVWAAQRAAAPSSLLGARGLVRLAAAILAFSVILNLLFSHTGQTVLLRLPSALPYVGGPVTLEAAVYGLTTGLSILALIVVVMTFNAAVEPAELLRHLPGFLHSAGLVITIALTFVPQTRRALSDIREAQQVRGHRARGLRDLPPLIVPLITSGLENAVSLAEAMSARGFGRVTADAAHALRLRLALTASLLGLLAGLAAYGFNPAQALIALTLVAASGLALVVLLWRSGQSVRRSRYAGQPWRRADTLVAALSSLLLAGWLLQYGQDPAQIAYDPYPHAALPPFAPPLGLLLLLLTAPLWLAGNFRTGANPE